MPESANTVEILLIRPGGMEFPAQLRDILIANLAPDDGITIAEDDAELTVYVDTKDCRRLAELLDEAGIPQRIARPEPPLEALGLPEALRESAALFDAAGIGVAYACDFRGKHRAERTALPSAEEIRKLVIASRRDPCIHAKLGVTQDSGEHSESISWVSSPDKPDGHTFPPVLKSFKEALAKEAAEDAKNALASLPGCPSQCPAESTICVVPPPKVSVRGPVKATKWYGYRYEWTFHGSVNWTVIKICR